MKRPSTFFAAHAILIPLAAMLLMCATPAAAQKSVAFVVGIKDYPNLVVKDKDGKSHLVNQLETPLNDADTVATTLKSLKFSDVTVVKNVTRAQFFTAFEAFKRKIEPGDTAFFFFAGHGVGLQGGNYLLPSDIPTLPPNSDQLLRDLSIAEVTVIAGMQQRGARLMIAVLDSCRDNPFESIATEQALADGLPVTRTRAYPAMLSRGLTISPVIFDNVLGIYSAGLGQTALDRLRTDGPNEKNSVFVRVFAAKIKQPRRSLSQIMDEVKAEVSALARGDTDKDGTPHRQTPGVYNQVDHPIYLAGLPRNSDDTKETAPPPPDEQMWSLVKDSTIAAVFDEFLRLFPSSSRAAEARTRLATLQSEERAKDKVAVGTTPPVTITQPDPPPPIGTISWKLQSAFTSHTHTSVSLFAKRVNELSNGGMRVGNLPAGAIVPTAQMLDIVRHGVLELGYGLGSDYFSKDKAFWLMSAVPFGFTPRDHIAFRRRPDVSAIFDRLLDKHGIVALPCGSFGRNGELWLRRPVRSASDLKGAKLWVVGLTAEIYKEIGAVPQSHLPAVEIYPALERGLLDGAQFMDPQNDLLKGFGQYIKYYYHPSSVSPSYAVDLFINKAKWNALPPTGRQIIEQACSEAVEAMISDYDRLNQEALAKFVQERVTVAALPASVERALYRASRDVLTKLAGENEEIRALLTIVDQMRANTVGGKLR